MGKYVEQSLGKNEVIVKKAELNALALLSAWIFGILFLLASSDSDHQSNHQNGAVQSH